MTVTSQAVRKRHRTPRARDVSAFMAARVHRDADPPSPEMASLMGKTVRTAQRWKKDGKGSPQDQYDQYFLASSQPYMLVAHVKSLAKLLVLEKKPTEELIARYLELLPLDKTLDAQDTNMDLARGISWEDRARMKRADGAINLELAAIDMIFAKRGVTEEEVFGPRGRSHA
jgi:hypothetical protein